MVQMNMKSFVILGTFFTVYFQCFTTHNQYYFVDSINGEEGGISFKDISYDEMEKAIRTMQNPDALTSSKEDALRSDKYSEVTTASAAFGIQQAKDGSLVCTPMLIRVRLVKGQTDVVKFQPQVLISGEIHGDERVGPLSSLVTTQLLVWSANCEISRHAASCRELDRLGGLSAAQRHWLAFLATSRDTLVVPAANCLGYIQRRREDAGVDPNRDFPYSRKNNQCMLSSTARLFMAIMIYNVIQVVVTFHGGMVALAYEWGSANHMAPRDTSPDDLANLDMAIFMKAFGGQFKKEKPYPIGRMNSMVYPVDGGMEDWLYAAGWDSNPATLKTCQVRASISEMDKQLVHSAPENRALVFLAETSDQKTPSTESLGGSYGILDSRSKSSGHIPRNVRLSLAAIDLVEPYVCMSGHYYHSARPAAIATSAAALDSATPTKKRTKKRRPIFAYRHLRGEGDAPPQSNSNNMDSNPNPNPKDSSRTANLTLLHFEWYVGGATKVDSTFLTWHIPSAAEVVVTLSADMEALFDTVTLTEQREKLKVSKVRSTKALLQYYRNLGRRRARSGPRSLLDFFPVVATFPMSGRSRWYHGSEQPDPPSSSSPVMATLYGDDDPIAPKQLFSALVSPSFQISNATLTHSRHNRRHLHPSFVSLPVSSERENAPLDPVPAGGLVGFPPGEYWLVAWAMVDQRYGEVGQGEPRNLPPQSHVSNARTNSSWYRESSSLHNTGSSGSMRVKKAVKGRKYWPSHPVQVRVTEDGSCYVHSMIKDCAWWRREAP